MLLYQIFFDTGHLSSKVNIASLTLVPKVANPTYASDFRPIACCTVVYNIIAKLITHRMQDVIGEVVDTAPAGFIPRRNITDNILVATDLIKGYTRKGISPRCTIKVDIKKAYDSIGWFFLKGMLLEVGFPHCVLFYSSQWQTLHSFSC